MANTGAFANIAQSTTDGPIITGVPLNTIRVLGLVVNAGSSATSITFNTKPAGAGTAISMTFQLAANGGAVLPVAWIVRPWFQTNIGDGLTATTSAGSTVGVQVIYDICLSP